MIHAHNAGAPAALGDALVFYDAERYGIPGHVDTNF